MKTLGKILIVTILGILMTVAVNAQKFETDAGNLKSLSIKGLYGEIIIKGTTGNQIVVEVSDLDPPPEKAEGLKPLLSGGVDNTGIGLNVDQSGGVLRIGSGSKESEDAEYTFLVPDNVAVKIDLSDPWAYDDLLVEDFGGELEVSALNPDIKLNNINGPVTLHAINGDIDITFDKVNQESPTSISAINGDINFIIPASTAVSFGLNTMHGEVYTDLDIKIEKDEEEEDEDFHYIGGHRDVNGTLNGGGVEVNLNAINGNIYIREK